MPLDPIIDQSIQSQAFNLALAELAVTDPGSAKLQRVKDAVMDAVVDLSNEGQTNVEQLTRYAVKQAKMLGRVTG